MFKLSCPKCRSSRIHRGYTPAPFYKRLLLMQNLLCNGCNLLFTAFVWPGTLEQHSRRKRKPRNGIVENSRQVQQTQATIKAARRTVEDTDKPRSAALENFAPVSLKPVEEASVWQVAPRSAALTEAEPLRANSFSGPRVALASAPVRENGNQPHSLTLPDKELALPALTPDELGSLASPSVPAAASVREKLASSREQRDAQPATLLTTDTHGHRAKSHRRKSSVAETDKREPGLLDYARFSLYYMRLCAKSKLGLQTTGHSLEVKFRWRNWWHWQRSRAR